jgi:Trypsin-like serine proteases, typically periplasmic, contain C-terminal PDZ domain
LLRQIKILIGLPGGKDVPGDLVAYDHSTGFGILKTILPTKLNPLQLGDSDNISEEDCYLLCLIQIKDKAQVQEQFLEDLLLVGGNII